MENKYEYSGIWVAVCTPPLENSGGVGTLFQYAKRHFPSNVQVRFLDTRGHSPWALLSLLNLGSTLISLTKMGLNRKLDVVHCNLGANGSTFRKLVITYWAKNILRVPVILQLHSSSFDIFYNNTRKPVQKLIQLGLKRADRILVLGEIWSSFLKENLDLPPDKVQVLVMGVPEISSEPYKARQFFHLLYAGELSERKGLPQLLDALSKTHSKIKLVIAGKGDTRSYVELATKLEILDRVRFAGFLPSHEIHKLLAKADCLILPSRAEGLPVSVLESLSAGRVPITTMVGALPEYLQNDINCILLTNNTSEAIQSVFDNLSKIDFVAMNSAAKDIWRNNFNSFQTTSNLIAIWGGMCCSPPNP